MAGDKRRRILEAAVKTFSAKGYGSSTTSEIAELAGVAEGTIFRYFKTKKDLLLGAFDQFSQIFADQVAIGPLMEIFGRYGELDAETVLRMVIKNRLQMLSEHKELVQTIAVEAIHHPGIINPLKIEMISGAFGGLVRIFKIGQESGEFRRDMDAHAIARSAAGTVMTFVIQRVFFGMDSGDIDTEVDDVCKFIMNGCKNSG